MAAVPTALLLIDCQAAFTCGSWARSCGAAEQVAPIRAAFARAAALLASGVLPRKGAAVLCTRCPFWSQRDFAYDESVAARLAGAPCFIKPDNDVFEADGWHEHMSRWLDRCTAAAGAQPGLPVARLVVGGCTLTSCVRVSARETQLAYAARGLEVVVDVSLCGARLANYDSASTPTHPPFRINESPVQCALRQLREVGVHVVHQFDWDALPDAAAAC
eukprot:TRINITY_DN1822_c0_g1_i1.p2 TRINITY_DN1822_c0_g1~~TRINITY_DN1822_c0_g1_i1.p2  ORF type:complete len:237 (+),score=93.33 TRINITY_DN1822_c0_g1_i1:60-713(+)